jgi:hypothetical protein
LTSTESPVLTSTDGEQLTEVSPFKSAEMSVETVTHTNGASLLASGLGEGAFTSSGFSLEVLGIVG